MHRGLHHHGSHDRYSKTCFNDFILQSWALNVSMGNKVKTPSWCMTLDIIFANWCLLWQNSNTASYQNPVVHYIVLVGGWVERKGGGGIFRIISLRRETCIRSTLSKYEEKIPEICTEYDFFYLPLEAFVKTVQSNFSKYVCSILMSFLLAECASNNSNIAIALQQFNHLRSLLVTFICIAACFDLPRETLLVCFNLLVLCIELSGVLFEIDANFDASWKCPSIVGFVHRPKAALVQN